MLRTRNIPKAPNTAKSEFVVDLKKLDKWFSVLQNVKASLKVTDWNNSQLDSVVLTKRDWSYPVVNSWLDKVTSQLYFNDINWESSHLLTDWQIFKDIDWNTISTPVTLSWEGAINNISVNSYVWYPIYQWKNYNGIYWSWDTVEYDYNTDLSKLTDNSWDWDNNELIWMVVVPNTENDSVFYKVEENWTNWVKVRWNIVWVQSTTTADITTTSTSITLASTQWFPTWWWSLKIWTNNDEIYYTAIEWNTLSDVTGISINYASWTIVSDWISKVAVWNTFLLKYIAITDKIFDAEKKYNSWWWGELVGNVVKIVNWTWAWQIRKIVSNTKHVINTDLAFSPVLDSSSTYKIYKKDWQVMYLGNWDNKMLRFDWTSFNEINAPSWKYIESFGWRTFIWNTTIVATDEISLKTTAFASIWSNSIYVTNVEWLATDWWLLEIANASWDVYTITYWDILGKELRNVSWLLDNLEKWDIIKYISKRREWTATYWTNNSITDSNRKFDVDVLKDMYLVIISWTNAWTKTKITWNTADTINLESSLSTSFDDTSEYQIHSVNKFNIYYSNVNDFEDFNPATRFITPPWSDEITWLKTWNDKLIIFKRRSIRSCSFVFNSRLWIFVPKLDKISSDTWCINGRSVVEVADSLWFFDWREYKSVWYSDTQIWVITTDSVSFQINKLFKDLVITKESDISAVYNNKKFYFAPTWWTVFVFDYEYNTWITYTWLDINSFVSDNNNKLYFWWRNNWIVSAFNPELFADNWVPINSVIETKAIDLGNDHLYKRFRYAVFAFENKVCTMWLKMIINSASQFKVVGSHQIIVWVAESWWLWLDWYWELWFWWTENANLFDPHLVSIIKHSVNKKWITMKLRVTNDNDENFSLSWMSFTYSVMKAKYFPNSYIR